jgi:hypothetical protein
MRIGALSGGRIRELSARMDELLANPMDVVERAQYAIVHGNSDSLHRELLAEVVRLRAEAQA